MSFRLREIAGVISTDDIIPGRYKHMHADPDKLAAHVFENRFPGMAATFREGDAIWCDATFGIGSSREQAATSLLAAGVRLVIAPGFGRIFFRNAWNVGLRLIALPRPDQPVEGQSVSVDWERGVLFAEAGPQEFTPPPERILRIADAGGLLLWVRQSADPATIEGVV